MPLFDAVPPGVVEVILDGLPVELPPERRSFSSIRSYLDSVALQQQRILCAINVDGEPVNLTQPRLASTPFSRVEAETMSLHEVPIQLIKAALQQTAGIRARVRPAVELVLINLDSQAREIWWGLAACLKEPLLTISLLPENICGPDNGRAPLMQLRKWQLEQLGFIIQEVDQACDPEDPIALSDALEKRVLPWLDSLYESLQLWHDTLSSHSHVAA